MKHPLESHYSIRHCISPDNILRQSPTRDARPCLERGLRSGRGIGSRFLVDCRDIEAWEVGALLFVKWDVGKVEICFIL